MAKLVDALPWTFYGVQGGSARKGVLVRIQSRVQLNFMGAFGKLLQVYWGEGISCTKKAKTSAQIRREKLDEVNRLETIIANESLPDQVRIQADRDLSIFNIKNNWPKL